MDYSEELRYRMTKTGYSTAVLAFAAFGAGVATYFGLRSLIPGDAAEGVIVPIVSAIVIAVGLFALWHKVISVVPLLHDPVKRASGVALGIGLAAITIAISSWFIATSIGGDQAVLAHLRANLSSYETQIRVANENAAVERDLIPDVNTVAAQLEALAEAERRLGSLSGIAGDGEVVQVLRSSAGQYRALGNEIKSVVRENDRLHAEAERLAGEMQSIINSTDGASASSQEQFSKFAIALQSVLTRIEKNTMLPAIQRYGIINVEYNTLQEGQRVAIQNARSSVEKFTGRLSKEAALAQKRRKKLEPISFTPVNRGMATWNYAGDVAAAWAVGIGIDLMPLVLLLLLMFGHAEAREPYQPRRPFETIEGGRSQSAA